MVEGERASASYISLSKIWPRAGGRRQKVGGGRWEIREALRPQVESNRVNKWQWGPNMGSIFIKT